MITAHRAIDALYTIKHLNRLIDLWRIIACQIIICSIMKETDLIDLYYIAKHMV